MIDSGCFQVANRSVGGGYPPFIVAEMSGNHNQSLQRALSIVEKASESGVHALKLQTYTPETMTIRHNKGEFLVSHSNSSWNGRSLYDLYQDAHTPWEWHQPIFDRCRDLGLICFSTPFDETAVDFLEDLSVPCYKIASFENIDIPLIKKVAEMGKPIFLSTGMASIAEIDEAVCTVREAGGKQLVLLKCTSTYPAPPEYSNVRTIPHMRDLFGCEAGLSDHTPGIGAALSAVALGAVVIEKHFTLCRKDGGVDAAFSMEPAEMKSLVVESERAWQSLGGIEYGRSEAERKSLVFRRSVYVVEDMKRGELFSRSNLRIIRPGFGLKPKYYEMTIGKRISQSVKRGTPLSWDLIG